MAVQKLFSPHNPLDDIPGASSFTNYDSDFDDSYQYLRSYRKAFTNSKYANLVKFLLVPYWINESFARIDYDYMKIIDYSNALKFLTEEERISLLSLSLFPIDKDGNNLLNLDSRDNPLLEDWEKTKGENISIYELNYYNNLMDKYKEFVVKRLSVEEPVQDRSITDLSIIEPPYRFINTEEYIAIVLNKTFYSYITIKENKLNFFQDLLKEIYTKIPLFLLVTDFRYQNIFNQYLNLLA